jgi:hypothetical protein
MMGIAAWLMALPPPPARAQDEVTWLLEQINSLRASLGLHPYSLNPQLSAAATQHSQYMAAGCDVSHTESSGSTPASRAAANGYGGTNVSENIYAGSSARAVDAWQFWINSPVHYAGLTHGYVNEVGIGIAAGMCQSYTLLFGHRDDVAAPPVPAPPPAGDGAAPAAPPTQRPYVPPPPTRTPTPTIPTLTPSATWTITPSHTPTLPPTATSVNPTAVLPPTFTAQPVALVASPTDTPSPSPSPSPTTEPPSPTPSPTPSLVPAAQDRGGGIDPRDLLPWALAAQILVIGLAGFIYFRRAR